MPATEDSFALRRLKKSNIHNKDALLNKYAINLINARDVRSEAISYLIRNRHVLNEELTFNNKAEKKFDEALIPSS